MEGAFLSFQRFCRPNSIKKRKMTVEDETTGSKSDVEKDS
jgi:hypothetical protein